LRSCGLQPRADEARRSAAIRGLYDLGLVLGTAASAAAQEACLRPVPPEAVWPPTDDAEFQAFLNEEYQSYPLQMQEYLNCLGREHEGAPNKVN
jgi:hypothetical protein